MRSITRTLLSVAAVGALALTGAACGEDDETVDTGQVAVDEPTLEVGDQTSNGAFVEIASVGVADGDGLVVIQVDVDGEPGPVIGWQALGAGLNSDLEVAIESPVADDVQLWATLWTDDGDGELDRESDQPVTGDDGEPVARSFRVLPEVDTDADDRETVTEDDETETEVEVEDGENEVEVEE